MGCGHPVRLPGRSGRIEDMMRVIAPERRLRNSKQESDGQGNV